LPWADFLCAVGAMPTRFIGRRMNMDAKQVIATRLAEWNLTLSDAEIEQLVPAYQSY
jgi:hypothetical protein